jgi:hypothetical protein
LNDLTKKGLCVAPGCGHCFHCTSPKREKLHLQSILAARFVREVRSVAPGPRRPLAHPGAAIPIPLQDVGLVEGSCPLLQSEKLYP